MLHNNQHTREPENLFETISALLFMLDFYCSEFALLLIDLCIDLVLLIAILCRQLGEHIAETIFDIVEGFLAPSPENEWEEEVADCDPHQGSASAAGARRRPHDRHRAGPVLAGVRGIQLPDLCPDCGAIQYAAAHGSIPPLRGDKQPEALLR